MPKQSSQPGLTLDFRRSGRPITRRWYRYDSNRPIFDPLVQSDGVVVVLIFPEQEFEMPFTESHEMVKAFILNGLDEPFSVRATA